MNKSLPGRQEEEWHSRKMLKLSNSLNFVGNNGKFTRAGQSVGAGRSSCRQTVKDLNAKIGALGFILECARMVSPDLYFRKPSPQAAVWEVT